MIDDRPCSAADGHTLPEGSVAGSIEDQTPLIDRYADSLIEERRIAKIPLAAWIADLARRIDTDPVADGLAAIQNNLGLILLHARGEREALNICLGQVAWAAGLRRADLMLQPIVNLARIDRMARRVGDARNKIAIVRDAGLGTGAIFAGHAFGNLEAQDRTFAIGMALIERFQLELGAGFEAVERYFADPIYVDAAASGSAMFAEQKLQAGIVHRCVAMFVAGREVLNARPPTSFAGIAGRYYTAVWFAEVQGDAMPALRLAEVIAKVATMVLAAREACDHRVLRLVHATARLSARFGLAPTQELYERCIGLAERMDDVHIAALAKLGAGHDPGPVADAVVLAGYRSLRGVPRSQAPIPDELAEALDEVCRKVHAARREAPEHVAA